jgi:hypothetical protein
MADVSLCSDGRIRPNDVTEGIDRGEETVRAFDDQVRSRKGESLEEFTKLVQESCGIAEGQEGIMFDKNVDTKYAPLVFHQLMQVLRDGEKEFIVGPTGRSIWFDMTSRDDDCDYRVCLYGVNPCPYRFPFEILVKKESGGMDRLLEYLEAR